MENHFWFSKHAKVEIYAPSENQYFDSGWTWASKKRESILKKREKMHQKRIKVFFFSFMKEKILVMHYYCWMRKQINVWVMGRKNIITQRNIIFVLNLNLIWICFNILLFICFKVITTSIQHKEICWDKFCFGYRIKEQTTKGINPFLKAVQQVSLIK